MESAQASRELHIEQLFGRRVVDVDGKHVGRIEELCATRVADECFVTEYLVGDFALLERLSVVSLGRSLLGFVPSVRRGYRIPWQRMDLSDPRAPRVNCRKSELSAA